MHALLVYTYNDPLPTHENGYIHVISTAKFTFSFEVFLLGVAFLVESEECSVKYIPASQVAVS